jgi:hypothetical protein
MPLIKRGDLRNVANVENDPGDRQGIGGHAHNLANALVKHNRQPRVRRLSVALR